MIDYRHETFLTLCRVKNYTKTAEELFITQPAVTQHIKYLENYYGGKLFCYKGKTLYLTQRGQKLYDFVNTMSADFIKFRSMIQEEDNKEVEKINFGATLSIGEFVCPEIISRLLKENPELHINMLVENTVNLLQELHEGKINFALVEGFFDKSKYGYSLFSNEKFIGVCGKGHKLAGKKIMLKDILDERLVIREEGSGTRNIFEHALYSYNLTINNFTRLCEIGNMSAIKQLVIENHGVTFMYKAAAQKELDNGTLVELSLEEFDVFHEFNFVYLKNSLHEKEYLNWLRSKLL